MSELRSNGAGGGNSRKRARARQSVRSWLPVSLVLGLILALMVLAALQYRWIDEASRADRERAQIALDTSVAQFLVEFRRDVTRSLAPMRREPRPPQGPEGFAERFWEALRTAPENGLLKQAYLAEPNQGQPRLRILDAERGWKPAEWPATFEPIRQDLAAAASPDRPDRGELRGPPILGVYEQIPAVVFTMIHFRMLRGGEPGQPPRPPEISEVLILELSEPYLRDELLPLLARKHFGGGLYQVEIVRKNEATTREVLFDSHPELGSIPESAADARAQLFGRLPERFNAGRPPFEADDFPDRPGRNPGFRFRLEPAREGGNFELLVRHRAGSLAGAISSLRSRNLAVSFSVLAVLAAAMALLVVSTQRARRLAKAQMDFVVSVSHELRTPLTVICSAGDNLADGVVDPNPAVKEYGAIVRDQGRSLRGMVEQILSLAASRANRILDLQPVELGALLPGILAENDAALQLAGFRVETELEGGLPPVLADEGALKQCIQNLLSNAIKYGAHGQWIGITARQQGGKVLLTVQDRGMGIERADLAHVFEPFYRGRAAQESQIHGTGIGLSLAREMMEAMGGRITVKSAAGKGSAFTLHLAPAPVERSTR